MTLFAIPADDFNKSRAGAAAGVKKVAGAGRAPRILIVEDEYLIALELEMSARGGFVVTSIVTTAGEAISRAGSEDPDLAIMDIRLAGSPDGVEAALELFRSFGIRSVFASAHADSDTRKRAASASPIGWVPKPYPADALLRLIRDFVK